MKSTSELLAIAVKFIKQRTMREKVMGAGAIAVVGSIAVYSFIIAPASEAFARQAVELRELTNTYDVSPDILARYAKLVARRLEIEGFYEKVDLKADPLSYLERLLKDSAQVPAGAYSVTPRDGAPLGEKYAHKIYTVKFETMSLDNLARFLKELTSGAQPMLLSQINMDKRATADVLQVQLEVSGFEAISK
jgi:hypothetical protein